MTGGPPVRGDLLTYWERSGTPSAYEREAWESAANRIVTGLATLAHLDAAIFVEEFIIAFPCGHDMKLALEYEQAIRSENVEARVLSGDDGAYGIALPCRPGATDEEIKHVVLAGLKAAHVIEFVPITDPQVLEQLAAIRAVEACVVNLGRKAKDIGASVRQVLKR